MLNNGEKKIAHSFDKSFYCQIQFNKPSKYKEIEKFTSQASNIITCGSNYSYSPIFLSKTSHVLDLRNFNRILGFSKEKKEITVESGLKISELLNFVLPHKLWIPQIPGYPFITVGGIVASNAHGKSCGIHGTIRKSIKSIKIFHKTNGWLNLSENENKEIFDLTIGGLGLTGTIVSVTFALEKFSGFFTTTKKLVKNLKETITELEGERSEKYLYSWHKPLSTKNFGKGIIFINTLGNDENVVLDNELNLNPKKTYSLRIWNRLTINLANFLFYSINKRRLSENEVFQKVIFPFYGNEIYFGFFGNKGFIETQLLIKKENFDIFNEELYYLIKKFQPSITLISLKKMSGEQKYLRFEADRICLTLDLINSKLNRDFMEKLDKICIKHNVIPSVIKDSRLDKKVVQNCYKDFESFKEKLLIFDKKRIYRSEVSDRLGI